MLPLKPDIAYSHQESDDSFTSSEGRPSLVHLQDVLSPVAFSQLVRAQQTDVDTRLGGEYAVAIQEMERFEAWTAAISQAIVEIKRSQQSHDDRMTHVEEEINSVRDEIQELLRPMKASYVIAETELRREKSGFTDFKTQCLGRMDALETSLRRAEKNVTVLQTQWATNCQTLEELSQQLAPSQELGQSLAARLLEMEEWEEGIWSLLKKLREDVHELTQPDVNQDSSDGCTSLASELALRPNKTSGG